MITLNEDFIILDAKDCPNNLKYIDFDQKTNYSQTNSALKINFKDDIIYNTQCIKRLQYLENTNIRFCSQFNNYNIKYIISNYNQDIISALKAISIYNKHKKYEYLYDSIFKSLDEIWIANNPCKFCNNICIASRHNMTSHKEDGCCYSFNYSKSPFRFIDNVKLCKYLDENKKCTTQNISCKLFVCNYLKKEKLFNIDMKDFILIQSFFSKKQQLILKQNFFKSKEEILNKLLEENNEPLIIYYLRNNYRID